MKKILLAIIFLLSFQNCQSMDIESFENFSNADKNSLEYSAAKLWIDGLIAGVITMRSVYTKNSDSSDSFLGINGGKICFPNNRQMIDVLMESGKRELSEKRSFYYGSKLSKKFPMEIVVWTGAERFFPCQRPSTN
jgi:hypothetical protein